jgi:hypothetical protein
MVALVAVLLVATGGSARAAHSRTSVGTGHASATPTGGRQVAAVPLPAHESVATHLDLATTPPVDLPMPVGVAVDLAQDAALSYVPADVVTAVGRAPPTV